MTKEDFNALKEEKQILRSYFEHSKDRKQKDFKVNVRRQSKEVPKLPISKPVVKKPSLFKCQFCSMVLFNTKDIQTHDIHSKTFSKKFFDPLKQNGNINEIKCNNYFISQKDWITEYDGNSGRILCPRKTCSVKLGTYSWSGLKCS